jgi:plastocyanin domain-containing protein
VTAAGFKPERIEARAGQPIRLAFLRRDAQNCAREVVIPDLNVRKDLPIGQPVVIELTPRQDIQFGCGMGMYRGAIVVGSQDAGSRF